METDKKETGPEKEAEKPEGKQNEAQNKDEEDKEWWPTYSNDLIQLVNQTIPLYILSFSLPFYLSLSTPSISD